MLKLKRKISQSVVIGDVVLKVERFHRGQIHLVFDVPPGSETRIIRQEVLDRARADASEQKEGAIPA